MFADEGKVVIPLSGETISSVAVRSGIYIDSPCAGNGMCGKCKVVVAGSANDVTDKEKEFLSPAELSAGVRLACQVTAVPNMVVSILNHDGESIEILNSFDSKKITKSSKKVKKFGIAIDVGTTSVVVYAVDKSNGKIISSVSAINPQTSCGADVISRISCISDDNTMLEILRFALVKQLNKMILEIINEADLEIANLENIVAAGNTTMEHILLGVSPVSIGRYPFTPQFRNGQKVKCKDVGFSFCPDAEVWVMPNISGFVGGDIVAGIVYSALCSSKELSLLLDIGTNNEMVLGSSDYLVCCSAAAGPAFEGAKISAGMRGARGAIEKVSIGADDIKLSVIGDTVPKGICGSGLIDITSELVRVGVITANGKFAKKDNLPECKWKERLVAGESSKMKFILAYENEHGVHPEVALTQKDVREVQLAKGAIAAGIEIMLAELGKDISDLDRVYIAGAFGNYINLESAMNIGIIPAIPKYKVVPLGNSAGLGACLMVTNEKSRESAKEVIDTASNIELALHPKFQDIFVKNISF